MESGDPDHGYRMYILILSIQITIVVTSMISPIDKCTYHIQ